MTHQSASASATATLLLMMVAVLTTSCPYSIAFASSFTTSATSTAGGAASRNHHLFKQRSSSSSSSIFQRAIRGRTSAQLLTSTAKDDENATNNQSSEQLKKEEVVDIEDPINDHGVEELFEQPKELVEAAHELAFVEPEEAEAIEASLRGGSSTESSSTTSSQLPAAPPPLPTLRQYLKFALPCLGLWVAGPLLSLVDTSFVGLSAGASVQTSSAQQLAALGPATTLYVSYNSRLVGCIICCLYIVCLCYWT